MIIHYIRFKGYDEKYQPVLKVLKIYMVLAMPYFIFGFGAFSNRYAFSAWFFIPLLQFFLLIYYVNDLRIVARYGSLFMLLTSFVHVGLSLY